MYNLRLYLKYIRYSVFKLPLIVKTYSYYEPDKLTNIITTTNNIYELTMNNSEKGIALFKKVKKLDFRKHYKYYTYYFIYKWIFLGYSNKKILHDCNWKEFKEIYSTLFFPNLITSEEINSKMVINKLTSVEIIQEKDSIFFVR